MKDDEHKSTEPPIRDNAKIQKARRHMVAVAAGLRHVLGPVDAAGICFGAGLELIASAGGGTPVAIAYLRELVAELENDETLPTEETIQ
jgi:hypothetical protein